MQVHVSVAQDAKYLSFTQCCLKKHNRANVTQTEPCPVAVKVKVC
jgi:hypothetical protein